MQKSTLFLAALMPLFFGVADSNADLISFDLSVANTSVTAGGIVNWTITATASDVNSGNFGIHAISTDLFDAGGHTLTPSSLGAPFSDYDFLDPGTPSGSSLIEISAALFFYDSTAEAPFGGVLGPLELASGSFVATNVGTHNLTITGGTANDYFINDAPFTADFVAYSTAFHGASYTVTPEPSSALCLVPLLLLGLTSRRKRT